MRSSGAKGGGTGANSGVGAGSIAFGGGVTDGVGVTDGLLVGWSFLAIHVGVVVFAPLVGGTAVVWGGVATDGGVFVFGAGCVDWLSGVGVGVVTRGLPGCWPNRRNATTATTTTITTIIIPTPVFELAGWRGRATRLSPDPGDVRRGGVFAPIPRGI